MILIDADVLGREWTGDETYVSNLLRELPAVAPELSFAAVTRHPELVPPGVEAIELPARLQELRMAVALPRLLRRIRPDLAHFQYAIPLGWHGKSVITVHDLSFEGRETTMPRLDRFIFRTTVPRAARKAAQVLTVSERTKRDLIARYGLEPSRITVTPNGVDPSFTPAAGAHEGYILFVGAIQARKNPEAALAAARALELPLLVVGPVRDRALAAVLEQGGAELRGYVSRDELAGLYRGAVLLVLPSRFEGFGLPVLEAMASGTPVVAADEEALREVGGDAIEIASDGDFAAAARRALERRDALVAAGLERARLFTWAECARRTAEVYRNALA